MIDKDKLAEDDVKS